MKTPNRIIAVVFATCLLLLGSCEKFEDLQYNPNVASSQQPVPPSRFLNRILYEIYAGGGYVDAESGSVFEGPWNTLGRWNQFIVSNDTYYGGNNYYDWSNSATMYSVLKNVIEMEKWANPSGSEANKINPYSAMGKFLRAYSFIWLTQRVGDIPMSQAGLGLKNLTPEYDTQENVYIQCLNLLEQANSEFGVLLGTNPLPKMDGDIYLNNNLARWQRVVNSYTIRVLISLSKRANDTPSLRVKERFANIINDPVKYPVMEGNADNVMFQFNSLYNKHPKVGIAGNYNSRHNVSKTYIDLAVKYRDPRLFVIATPAPAQIKAGKQPDDHTAYMGSDNNLPIAQLSKNSSDGMYSFSNYNRYYKQDVVTNNPEPYIIIGYAESCLNIAEGLARGWATGNVASWYNRGITASMAFYGIAEGANLVIGDVNGKVLGSHTVSLTAYFAQPAAQYNASTALEQILEQKFLAFFQNSGWEAYYQWRRTGIPAFLEGGSGVNATGKIPRRFQYPMAEKRENAKNFEIALNRQFGGKDDLYQDIWAIK